jgi:hypothetical protein
MLVSLEQLKLESNLQAAADSKKKISPAEQQVITDNTTVKGKILGKDDNFRSAKRNARCPKPRAPAILPTNVP